MWFDVARELTERWHHQQQIRDAVGRPPLYERYLAPVIDTFVRALPYTYRDVDAPEGTTIVLRIDDAAWSLVREAIAWQLFVGRRGLADDGGHDERRRRVARVHEAEDRSARAHRRRCALRGCGAGDDRDHRVTGSPGGQRSGGGTRTSSFTSFTPSDFSAASTASST